MQTNIKKEVLKMEIKISISRYDELVKASERIAAVERMFKSGNYVSTDDIKVVLGIEVPEGEPDVEK